MNRVNLIDQRIQSIAKAERELLSRLIVELKDLESVKGYRAFGQKSLFEYLTKRIGYSNGSAQRRIDAARLAADVPDLPAQIESGAIEFHHITTVKKALRQVKRHVSADEKREILSRIARQTEAQTQATVAQYFDLAVISSTKKTVQKDGSVRLEITISQEVAELIERAQGLISHAVPSRDLAAFLEYAAQLIVKQKTSSKKSTATMAVTEKVPAHVHRELRREQPACAKCGSLWFVQTDHIKPRWAGGGHEPANLQTLCGPCNREKYRLEKNTLKSPSVAYRTALTSRRSFSNLIGDA